MNADPDPPTVYASDRHLATGRQCGSNHVVEKPAYITKCLKNGISVNCLPQPPRPEGNLPNQTFRALSATEIDFPYYSLTDLERLVQITAPSTEAERLIRQGTGHPNNGVRFQTTLFVSERFCRSLRRKPYSSTTG